MVINRSYGNWLQQYRLQYKASITIQSSFRCFHTRNINLQFKEAGMINKEEKIDPTVNTNIGKPSTPNAPCTTHGNGESIDYPQPDINDGEGTYVIDTKCESIDSYPHDTNDGEGIKHSAYVIDTKCESIDSYPPDTNYG